jgi:hypothetical protein
MAREEMHYVACVQAATTFCVLFALFGHRMFYKPFLQITQQKDTRPEEQKTLENS